MSPGLGSPIPVMVHSEPLISIMAVHNEAGQLWAALWPLLVGETSVHPGMSSLPVFVS